MKRLSLCLTAFSIAIGLASLAPRPAAAETSVSIGVNVGGPPPVVVWRREPRLYMVPGTSVYCYNDGDADYDYFEYGTSFYIFSHDRWYRAPSWRGPFVYIREDYVPRAFYVLGDRGYRWRHSAWRGVPPGQFRREEVHRRNEERREVRDDRRGDRHDRKEHKDHGKHGGGGDD